MLLGKMQLNTDSGQLLACRFDFACAARGRANCLSLLPAAFSCGDFDEKLPQIGFRGAWRASDPDRL
jgi:hypothetical protein